MRVIALSIALLGLLASAGAAQDTAGAVQPRLLDVLRQIGDAFDRRDTAGVRRLLADGYTSTEPDGQVFQAWQVVERAVNNPPDLKVHQDILEPSTEVSAGGDHAVMHYRSILAVEQGGRPVGKIDSLVTATFVRRDGAWLLASQRSEDAPQP
ncbi:MAG TPA: nuclear transport factor 2 family protein [Longimicrobium sp.]